MIGSGGSPYHFITLHAQFQTPRRPRRGGADRGGRPPEPSWGSSPPRRSAPGYSTRDNTISDLGASMPPESIIVEPSATIFNVTVILTGLLVIAGALLLFGAAWGRGVASLVGLFGVGVLGVGLFPGDDPVDHPISAMLAFVAGGLSAVAAVGAKVSPLPMHIDGPGGGRPPGSGPLLRPGAWEPLCGPGDRRSGEVGGVPDRPLDHRVRGASDGLGPSG